MIQPGKRQQRDHHKGMQLYQEINHKGMNRERKLEQDVNLGPRDLSAGDLLTELSYVVSFIYPCFLCDLFLSTPG